MCQDTDDSYMCECLLNYAKDIYGRCVPIPDNQEDYGDGGQHGKNANCLYAQYTTSLLIKSVIHLAYKFRELFCIYFILFRISKQVRAINYQTIVNIEYQVGGNDNL